MCLARGVRAAGALSASLRLRVLLLHGTGSPRGMLEGSQEELGAEGAAFKLSLPLSEAVGPPCCHRGPLSCHLGPPRCHRGPPICFGAGRWAHPRPPGASTRLPMPLPPPASQHCWDPPEWVGALPPKPLAWCWGSTTTVTLGVPNRPPAPSPSFGGLRGHRALVPASPSPGAPGEGGGIRRGLLGGPRCPHGSFKKPTTSSRNELKVTAGNLRTWQRGGEGSGRREGGGKQPEIKPNSPPGSGDAAGGAARWGAAGCTAGVPPLGAQPQNLKAPLRSALCPPMCPKLSEQSKVSPCPQSHPGAAQPEPCPCCRDTHEDSQLHGSRAGGRCWPGGSDPAAAPSTYLARMVSFIKQQLPESHGLCLHASPGGSLEPSSPSSTGTKKVHRRAPKPRKLITIIKKPSTAHFLNPWHCN